MAHQVFPAGSRPLASICVMLVLPTTLVAADVIVVCPPQFRDALSPWVEHRRDQGLSVETIDSHRDADALAGRIRNAASPQTRFVVLLGDAPTMGQPCDPETQVPLHYRPTTVSAQYGSTPLLSTDGCYGDLDGDGHPDAAVGRLPVDTPAELKRLIARIIAHESSRDFGAWRNRVNLIGGVGGFGPLIDSTIETATRTIVTATLPRDTCVHVAHASPGHPFFPSIPFTTAVLQRYREGCRFWVYAGHGLVTELDRVPPGTGTSILDCTSVRKLERPLGASPIALLLACYSGAVDGPQDSLAEEMLRCDGGPIAILAGSRVTMPYGNTLTAMGMIHAVYTEQSPRLGTAWLRAAQQMHQEQVTDSSPTRAMIDALAGMFSPKGTKLVEERREHLMLYNLIGDPTLQLHHPQTAQVEVTSGHAPGEDIHLSVTSPLDGQLTISLELPLGSGKGSDPNDVTLASLTAAVFADQPTEHTLRLPTGVDGPILVRAMIAGETGWATGSARTIVH